MEQPVEIDYFSDVLCIWAYVSERRVEELVDQFGDKVAIRLRVCSVFPDALTKLQTRWASKGGLDGYADHVHEVAEAYPHIKLNKDVWRTVRPTSSAGAHLLLKALQLESGAKAVPGSDYLKAPATRFAAALRHAFFAEARDISDCTVLSEILIEQSLDPALVTSSTQLLNAASALSQDLDDASARGVSGSPTFLMNHDRQRLFGNVLRQRHWQFGQTRTPQNFSWC